MDGGDSIRRRPKGGHRTYPTEGRGSSPLISTNRRLPLGSLLFILNNHQSTRNCTLEKNMQRASTGSSAFEGDLNRSGYAAEAGAQ